MSTWQTPARQDAPSTHLLEALAVAVQLVPSATPLHTLLSGTNVNTCVALRPEVLQVAVTVTVTGEPFSAPA